MNLKSTLVSVFGAGIIALSMVGGVAAQNTSAVDVNVAVNMPVGGTVSWTVTVADNSFPAVEGSLDSARTTTGTLNLTVTDTRFNRQGWSISMGAQDFTGQAKQEKIGVENFSLAAGTVTVNAGDSTALPKSSGITMGTTPKKVLVADLGTGSGRYTVPMTGSITVPANTQADTYKTTINVSGSTAP